MARLIFLTLCMLAGTAHAADKSMFTHYPVTGKSAKDIHDSIRKSAPRIAPGAVYAFTIPSIKTEKVLRKGKATCSYARFRTLGHYTIVLPKLVSSNGVPAQTLTQWRSFADYLKTHEEGHRTIWRKCLAEYDAKTLELKATTCEKLDAAREKLFTAIKKRCVAQDEKYDFYFRKDVVKQPFARAALSG